MWTANSDRLRRNSIVSGRVPGRSRLSYVAVKRAEAMKSSPPNKLASLDG